MSPTRTQAARCPRCGETHPVEVRDAIDVAREPALKAELLSSRLFAHACPACGARWHAARTLLYQDAGRGLFIWLFPGEATEEARARLRSALDGAVGAEARAASTLRLVSDPRDLIEKVLIFDAGLSDMIVELLKVFAAGLAPGAPGATLRFSPTHGGDLVGHELPFALVGPGDQIARLSVPWAQYAMVAERYPGTMVAAEAARGELVTVDQAFALDAIKAAAAGGPARAT